jgi:hypothetical protein
VGYHGLDGELRRGCEIVGVYRCSRGSGMGYCFRRKSVKGNGHVGKPLDCRWFQKKKIVHQILKDVGFPGT